LAAISSAVEDADTTGDGVNAIVLVVEPIAVDVIEEGATDSKELIVVVTGGVEVEA
jgi:hypothetical protein